MRAVGLRCEHREDIPCIDDPAPRLGWQLESEEADQRQTGYRIDEHRLELFGRCSDCLAGGPT